MNKYLRKLLKIAVPLMISNVIAQVQMLIDRIFLGQMNTLYMSALGNVNTPLWMSMSVCFTLVTGASILISQNVGADDKDNIHSYAASMFKWNNVLPVLMFFFWFFFGEHVFKLLGVSESIMPYCKGYVRYFAPIYLIVGIEGSFNVIMQTSNYTKPLVYFGALRAGLNIILDYIMIFGKFGFPEMGIEGAAMATTISEYAGLLLTVHIVIKSKELFTRPSLKSIIRSPLKPFLTSAKLGINVAVEDFVWNLGNLAIIRILNSINELAAGIYSIVLSIEIIVVVLVVSLGNATMTLTGEARGNRNLKQFREICKIAYLACIGITTVSLAVSLAIPQLLLSLFTKDTAIITGCGIYLALISFNLYGKSANIIIGNGIRGSGNTIWMLKTQFLGLAFIVGFCSLFVYVFNWGIAGVFLAVIVDEIARALINFAKLKGIMKHWDSLK
ncbi:MAG: MATE family efflux transporter [Treponema sp.]|nr:MATE family efflux transporter [Candidatus Treponema equifaecale]